VDKSTHTPQYDAFRARLVELRQEAGLSQRELASRLEREHSFVARVELGDRRVDIVELYMICSALDVNAEEVAAELMRGVADLEV